MSTPDWVINISITSKSLFLPLWIFFIFCFLLLLLLLDFIVMRTLDMRSTPLNAFLNVQDNIVNYRHDITQQILYWDLRQKCFSSSRVYNLSHEVLIAGFWSSIFHRPFCLFSLGEVILEGSRSP